MSLVSIRSVAAAGLVLAGTMAVVSSAQAQQGSASGEVRRIDAEAGKITLKHGSIEALQLPAMTLVYLIQMDQLAGIEPGDKVKFTAERRNDQYVIIKISK
ncbi:MAG TPA: copper-binding protein [Paenalcaligenes hominis]|uniref:Copper-binding protein n=1 Tax=Paenalcaligenes hominis TaxID=643674 RepID=A0A9D3AAS9_9BURK|nr:copper-binding protein [Paenalcaligenes hominis]